MPNVVKIQVKAEDQTGSTASVIRGGLGVAGKDAADDFSSNFNRTLQSKTPPKVKVQAELDAAQLRAEAQAAADKAKAKVILEASLDKAQLLAESDRAAAEAKAQIKYTAQLDTANLKAKAAVAAAEAKAEIKFTATVDQPSMQSAGEQAGQTLTKAVKQSASTGGKDIGVFLPALITTGITAGIPLVAGAASALGVAAVGAVGVAMQRKNPAIDGALSQLTSTFEAGATEASGVIVGPIENALGSLTKVVQNAEPELDSMFQGVASDIPVFASGLEGLVQGALPGFTSMVNSSKPVVQGMSTVLRDIGQGVGDIASTIAHDSPEIGQDLASFGQVAKNSAVAIGGLVDIAAKLGVVVGPVLEGLTTAIGSVTTGFESNSSVVSVAEHANDLAAGKFLNVKAALEAERAAADNATDSIAKYTNGLQLETVSAGFTGASETIAEGLAKIGDKSSDDTAKVQGLETALMGLVNPGGAAVSTLAQISSTELGLADSMKGLTGQVADQNGNFDLNTKKGAAAATAIEGLATNYNQYIAQAEQAHVPMDQINANLDKQYQSAVKTAEGWGVNKDKVGDYLASLGLVPPEKSTQIATPGMEQAIADVLNLHGQIDGVPTDHTITATALTSAAIQQLKDLGYTVTSLPNGEVKISANTSGAVGTINSLISSIDGRVATLQIHGVVTGVTGGGSITNLLHSAGGPVPGRAVGGAVTSLARNAAGGFGLTELDENGPEIASLPNGTMISPEANTNAKLQALQSRAGGAQQITLLVAPDADGAVATMLRKLVQTKVLSFVDSTGQPVRVA